MNKSVRWCLMIAAACLMVVGAQVSATASTVDDNRAASSEVQPAAWPTDGSYELMLDWGSRCLEGWYGSVYQWTCHRGNHQTWHFVDRGAGYYQIVNNNDGLCLDVSWGSPQDGTDVVGATCHDGLWQQWALNYIGSGMYEIKARHSGKCLDIRHGGAGSTANQWTCHGGGNQHWHLNAR